MTTVPDRAPAAINRPVSALVLVISALLAIPLFAWIGVGQAHAAERGVGYGLTSSLLYNGTPAYCIELTKPSPVGVTTRELASTDPVPASLARISLDDRARLHWAIATLGAATDPRDTAAVALYAWQLADPEVFAQYGGATGSLVRQVPASELAEVKARFERLRSEGAKIHAVQPDGSESVSVYRVDGQLELQLSRLPQRTELVVSLEGAVFADGSQQRVFQQPERVTLRELDAAATVSGTGSTRNGLALRSEGDRVVTVGFQLRYAPGYWSPNLRALETKDRQLLVAAAPGFPMKRLHLSPASGATETVAETLTPTPTATPSPTPSPTPMPEPTPTATPTPTPLPTPDGDQPTSEPSEQVDEPTEQVDEPEVPAAEPSPTAPVTPQPTTTTTPTTTPTSTPAPAPAPTSPQRTEPTATTPATPQQPQPATTEPPALAETGANFNAGTLMLPLGAALTLIALGGFALTRRRGADAEADW